jgi:hypothetical protein
MRHAAGRFWPIPAAPLSEVVVLRAALAPRHQHLGRQRGLGGYPELDAHTDRYASVRRPLSGLPPPSAYTTPRRTGAEPPAWLARLGSKGAPATPFDALPAASVTAAPRRAAGHGRLLPARRALPGLDADDRARFASPRARPDGARAALVYVTRRPRSYPPGSTAPSRSKRRWSARVARGRASLLPRDRARLLGRRFSQGGALVLDRTGSALPQATRNRVHHLARHGSPRAGRGRPDSSRASRRGARPGARRWSRAARPLRHAQRPMIRR